MHNEVHLMLFNHENREIRSPVFQSQNKKLSLKNICLIINKVILPSKFQVDFSNNSRKCRIKLFHQLPNLRKS